MNLVELLRLYSRNICIDKLSLVESLLQRVETPYWLSADKLEKKKLKSTNEEGE